MRVRRVVTGHTDERGSVFVSDEDMEPVTAELMAGYEFFSVWATGGTPSVPVDGSAMEPKGFFPAPPGVRFLMVEIPPDSVTGREGIDEEAALEEISTKLPGLLEAVEADNPGFHTSDTVDVDLVLSGEVVLELDDGAEVTLGPGECVVQTGTRHRWRNHTDKPVQMVTLLVGAHRL
jgi:mannose-6-phosphate isomerase-like protein (cupin superfamily)